MLMQLSPTYASDLQLSEYQIRQLMARQERAIAANDCILNGIGFLENGTVDYKDSFAGMRIEENELVVSLIECAETVKEKYLSWASEYADVIVFEEVEYSYKYLASKTDYVLNELYEQTGTTVLGCYISEINNSIVLMIDEDTQEIIEKQRATISYSVPIEFEVSDVVECTSVEIKGGDMLYNMDCYRYTSVGCCGYYRGVPAIATCGHGSSAVGERFAGTNLLNGYIGTVALYNFNNGSYGDYAIISGANSNYTHTNKIGSTYSIKGVVSNPPVGTTVYFYGQTTKQYCVGEVTQRWVSCKVEYDGATIEIGDLTQVKVNSGTVQSGDSGGTVFTLSSGTTNANFAGVISGDVDNSKTGEEYMYFSPASFFISAGFSVKTS